MQFISEEYRKLNEQLHETVREYGISSVRHVREVINICKSLETTDVLDYGCGKSSLARNLPFTIQEYDPAIPKHAALPTPADIVVCTDVLEHIEPELLDNVLNHLQSLVKKAGFFTIATRPAKKILADGRNAHLIIQPMRWWVNKLIERFDIRMMQKLSGEFVVIVEPLGE